MADHNTIDAVSRRNVLKATGGLLAGSTMLAGLGAGRGAAATEEGLRFEVEEANKDGTDIVRIVARVRMYEPLGPFNDAPDSVYLGHAERFVIHEEEDVVSLPEDTDGLAHPVEMERLDERTYGMHFRTAEVDFSEAEGEEVTLGLGLFRERIVPEEYFDTTGGEIQ